MLSRYSGTAYHLGSYSGKFAGEGRAALRLVASVRMKQVCAELMKSLGKLLRITLYSIHRVDADQVTCFHIKG